jgi:hypothetical protein
MTAEIETDEITKTIRCTHDPSTVDNAHTKKACDKEDPVDKLQGRTSVICLVQEPIFVSQPCALHGEKSRPTSEYSGKRYSLPTKETGRHSKMQMASGVLTWTNVRSGVQIIYLQMIKWKRSNMTRLLKHILDLATGADVENVTMDDKANAMEINGSINAIPKEIPSRA